MHPSLRGLLLPLAALAVLQGCPAIVQARMVPGVLQEASGCSGTPAVDTEAATAPSTPTPAGPAATPAPPQPMVAPTHSAASPFPDVPHGTLETVEMSLAPPTLASLSEARPALAAGQAVRSLEASTFPPQWPPEIEVISQPALAVPRAVIPLGVLIGGTAPAESVVVEYDLQRLSWPDGQGARTPPLPVLPGLNLVQWQAPGPSRSGDFLWYRVVADGGRGLPPLRSADQCLPYGRCLNAGSSNPFPQGEGCLWEADRAYYPGSYGYVGPTRVLTAGEPIRGAESNGGQEVFRHQRASVDGAPFHYRFWLGSGLYQARLQVELCFAELEASGPGQRVFDVMADGQPLIEGLDLWAVAGPCVAHVITREVTVTYQPEKEPLLDLAFVPRAGDACVAGVAVRGVEAVPQYLASMVTSHPADDVHAAIGERRQRHEPFVRLGRYTDGSEYAAGLLFRGVPVPGQAYVSSAWLELSGYPGVGRQHGQADVTIYAQATDSARDFGRHQQCVTARALTSVGVRWLIDRPWSAGETYRSPDLRVVLQELFDRPNWRPGNNLTLLIMPNGGAVGWRDAVAQEWVAGRSGVGSAATLHITYVPPLAGGAAP
ncbi:MAG: malectin [Anaerolineae bacterium]|nr:malectin [Anaerolineae bacterium]